MFDTSFIAVCLIGICAAVAIARALIIGGKQPDYWFKELGRRTDDKQPFNNRWNSSNIKDHK